MLTILTESSTGCTEYSIAASWHKRLLSILESAAAGSPIALTPVGVAGLDLRAGCENLVTDTPDAIVRSAVQLLQNRERRLALARRGMRAVRERYDWEQIAEYQQAVYQLALEARRQP